MHFCVGPRTCSRARRVYARPCAQQLYYTRHEHCTVVQAHARRSHTHTHRYYGCAANAHTCTREMMRAKTAQCEKVHACVRHTLNAKSLKYQITDNVSVSRAFQNTHTRVRVSVSAHARTPVTISTPHTTSAQPRAHCWVRVRYVTCSLGSRRGRRPGGDKGASNVRSRAI